MKSLEKTKSGLDKKFRKILETPASFDFFMAIHDFIEYVELDPMLAGGVSGRTKVNRELDIPNRYGYLRQIYQGLEDINTKSSVDLGHVRYGVIKELNRIQNKDVSESVSLWKKRELFRKLAGEVYERLDAHLSESKRKK
jgi:hypothetical protein